MATAALFLPSRLLLSYSSSFPPYPRRTTTRSRQVRASYPGVRAVAESQKEEGVVIVGAGIGGLAAAVSLNRLGVRSVVLEQGDSLRTSGTSLTLFKNGWRVLDSIGVGNELRSNFLELQGLAIRAEDGRLLRSFSFEETPGQEVRAVERGVLLEALANQLPPGTIHFASRLKDIQRKGKGRFLLHLEDGTELLAKIVIGSDGIRSPVARWMGFSEPRYVGHCAFRGLAIYPEGQPFEPKVNNVYGRGLRAGCVPVSTTKVYWFICFNSRSPGSKTVDPSILKKEALQLVRNWPPDIIDVIERTPDSSIIKTRLEDRWLWPILSPPASSDGVVVMGDAWHPMTPNLGQGACCALEDAVTLAGKLASAIGKGQESISEALDSYTTERWGRVFPLTIRSYLVGSLLQWDDPLICAVRNRIVIPKLARLGPLLEHTNFECELLEPMRAISSP